MCDGIGGGVDKDAALCIMKDSRLGTYGVTGLLFVLGIKVSALAAFTLGYIPILLVVGHCFSRLSAVLVILTSNYARDDGKAKSASYGLSVKGVWLLAFTGLALSVVVLITLGFTLLMGMWAGTFLGHILTRWQFEKKLGGYTGDCLGATQQVSETGLYLGALMCI
jgi:adenosylcobinamide-GDP ribazoletransferase